MNLHLQCTPVFDRNYSSDKKIVINRGGTRSSKSYSLAQLAVIFLFTGRISETKIIKDGVWSIVRKSFPSLKASIMRDVIEILKTNDLYKLVQHNRTDNIISYKERAIEFFSVDDQQKVRGRKRAVLHCNEANELNYLDDFRQLLLRTSDKVYLDFNPDDENIWINTELEQKRYFEEKDVEVIVSTYRDNTFLSPEIIKEIELLEKTDPQFWQIFGLGEYGKITGLIFNNYHVIDQMPQQYRLLGYGLDFGFTHDPSALIEVGLYDGCLLLNELIYERGLTNPEIVERLNFLGVDRSKDIIADSAEPKSIEEIYRMGVNIKGAVKGPDSVKMGIDIMKRYEIKVTAKSVNLLKELRSYKWAVDKNGNSLNVPIDKQNHAIDAIRYQVAHSLGERKNSGRYFIV